MSALNVFGFLMPGKDAGDPLQTPRLAASWLRDLPRLDVIERQHMVMQAFAGMRESRKPFDFGRVNAISFLDAALGADRRQLIKQYVENVELSPQLAERLWQAVTELTQGFTYAYRVALDQGVEQAATPRWKALLPMLFARLVHYYGTDAKLRVFRFERWIPAKWRELHELYRKAAELGIARAPTTLVNGANAMQWSVEQEFIFVLLIHQLNAGNLTPAELDWASAQLRAWSRRLVLDAAPRSNDGFVVDLSGKAGLGRRTGHESGALLRYLDTTPLVEQLERAIAALRRTEAFEPGVNAAINAQRIGILERLRPSIAPNLNAELRRDPRVPVEVAARVRVGLARICRDLANPDDPADASAESSEHIEVYAVNDGSRPRRRLQEERDSMMVSLAGFSDPAWQVKDRSLAGLRIAASGGIGQSLALGALVAVRQSDLGEWVIGVVRRVNKLSKGECEAGLSIITDRAVPVTLHARREGNANLGMEVDGLDVSTIGARFDGLYLPPPARADKPITVKSLVIPTTEYVEGREIILATDRSIYTVALRTLIEQRAEWTWAAIQIVDKKVRPL